MKPLVVVGLSGGVDSSVAAWRLLEAGYRVKGVYMKNWEDTAGLRSSKCPFDTDSEFAEMVARRLKIEFEIVNLAREYRARVVEYLFSEYGKGRTPNPDVLCNREIKFAAFWEVARRMGAEYVATGHYVRKETFEVCGNTHYRLLAGVDGSKDQSYFLCQVSQEQLQHALFPLGEMVKSEVRAIARNLGLATAARKDSYGICFVGEVDLPQFLSQRLAAREGPIVELPPDMAPPEHGDSLWQRAQPYTLRPEMGVEVGRHHGAHFFTIGQRKGINVGGKAQPLFVVGVDVASNTLYVAQGHGHPLLNRQVVLVRREEVHWIDPYCAVEVGTSRRVEARLRYRQPLQGATLHSEPEGVYLEFDTPQRGVTPGQFAAWYHGAELLGSGPVNA